MCLNRVKFFSLSTETFFLLQIVDGKPQSTYYEQHKVATINLISRNYKFFGKRIQNLHQICITYLSAHLG